MARKRGTKTQKNASGEILRDLLIVQLAVAGVPQKNIRQIAGCDINRVNRIAKHVKSKREKAATAEK